MKVNLFIFITVFPCEYIQFHASLTQITVYTEDVVLITVYIEDVVLRHSALLM